MAINKIVKNSLGADAIDATKIADNAVESAQIKALNVTTAKLAADAVDATKIADDSISEEHLDTTAITGFGDLGSAVASTDQIVVYDQSSGTLKKISQTNFLNFPTVSSVSPTNAVSGDGTGNHTFTITGTGFTGASANLINTSGTAVAFDSVTVNSPTQITGVIAKSSLLNSGEPYDVKVTAGSGLSNTLENQINVDASPIFVTASGSLGSKLVGVAGSFAVNATDPDSAGNVTFELQSGSLPPSYTLTNTAAEGGTAIIAGTDSTTSSTTTFNFVLRAVDAASNTSSRAFSIIISLPVSESFTSSGTFSVPAGTTVADVLVVAGGGGAGGTHAGGAGAGGVIFFPNYPVTTGTITVTVGCGGAGTSPFTGNVGQNSVFGSPGDPGLGQGGVLTSVGGGAGGGGNTVPGGNGGSGGGSGYGGSSNGTATQPTQPGNSGAYGFGNPGGNSGAGGPKFGTGGGGGAGAAGQSGNNGAAGAPDAPYAGNGGAGRAYTISDGTTSVYYAGGGGGASGNNDGAGSVAPGGQGGGGEGHTCGNGQPGQANKGGGGGGTDDRSPYTGGTGGKGIVIVRY